MSIMERADVEVALTVFLDKGVFELDGTEVIVQFPLTAVKHLINDLGFEARIVIKERSALLDEDLPETDGDRSGT